MMVSSHSLMISQYNTHINGLLKPSFSFVQLSANSKITIRKDRDGSIFNAFIVYVILFIIYSECYFMICMSCL